MKYKIAFFDLDWTLYDHKNHRWDKESVESVNKLQKEGCKLFICTARPYFSFKELGALDLGIKWDGFISCSGGCAYYGDELIFETSINHDDVRSLIEMTERLNGSLELVEKKECKMAVPFNEGTIAYFQDFVEEEPPVGEYQDENVISVYLFIEEKYDEIYKGMFPHLQYYRYSDISVDISQDIHDKGEAIKIVLDHLGIKKEEALGFGDDIPDISIAKNVGYFVALGNAKDEVKEVASKVTDPVWEVGVGKAIDELL